MLHHMYTVGLDVDKFVFTVKILLYAGNSWLSSPLVFIALGTIYLYFTRQSAGNFCFKMAKAVIKNTFIELPEISKHVPIRNNLKDEQFGYFLTGLIEGDGWFGKKQLHILFTENDTSLAYYIKKRIGYGNIYKIKDKKTVKYVCNNEQGLSAILLLINGKFISNYIYQQLIKLNYSEDFDIHILSPLTSLSLHNHWLAGFTQAKGNFHISVVKNKTDKPGYTVRLVFSLKENDFLPLNLLYNKFKIGNLFLYNTDIWCYKSTEYKTAAHLINYFDKYKLFTGKYLDYLKFRKVYIMITEGKHLKYTGINKIKKKTKKMLKTNV